MKRTRRPIAPDPRLALAQRNAEMVRRYEAGESLARIGASLGLTRERLRQIVKDGGAVMPWAYICAVDDCRSGSPTDARVQPTCRSHGRSAPVCHFQMVKRSR